MSFIIAGLVLASCGETRPTVTAWEKEWTRILSIVPDQSSLGENPSQAICEEVLASLRSSKDALFPTPDSSIDETATLWFQTAEGAFFECPPGGGATGGFAGAYAELGRLQAEIEVVLAINRNE